MKNRNCNVDIIRIVAVWSVLSIHFFLNNGYYNEILRGKKLYVGTIMRTEFMICVPLFLLLTGYLMCKKELTKKYYAGIGKTIGVYCLATICICIYRIGWLHEEMDIADIFFNITSYQQYSWYVGMYICLFLLIPFLNILYNNIPTPKQKKLLLLTLLILTTLPTILNTFDFLTANWLMQPAISANYQKLVPDFWSSTLYPITFYFIGAYIREYQDDFKLSLKMNFALIVLCTIIFGSYTYWRSYNTRFIWGIWAGWGGFQNVIDAVLIFLFLLRIKVDWLPNIIKRVLAMVADNAFAIYIVSWIFDQYSYPLLNATIPYMPDRLVYYFVVVPFNFVCSTLLACLVNALYKGICNGLRVCKKIFA